MIVTTDILTKDDLKQLKELYFLFFDELYKIDTKASFPLKLWISQIPKLYKKSLSGNKNRFFIVKNEKDHILGFSYITIDEENIGTIVHTFVKEEYRMKILTVDNQRNTIMTALYKKMMEYLNQCGVKCLQTEILKDDIKGKNRIEKQDFVKINETEESDFYQKRI